MLVLATHYLPEEFPTLELDINRVVSHISVSFQHSGPGPSCVWELKVFFKSSGVFNNDVIRFAINFGTVEMCLANNEERVTIFTGALTYFKRNE